MSDPYLTILDQLTHDVSHWIQGMPASSGKRKAILQGYLAGIDEARTIYLEQKKEEQV